MFYLLNGKSISSWIKGIEGQETLIKNDICSKCYGQSSTYVDRVKINVIGKRLYDYYSNYLFPIVSQEFKDIVEENELTGVKFIELEVNSYLDANRKIIDVNGRLYKMIVTGRTGMWRDEDGDLLKFCDKCNRVIDKKVDDLKGCSTLDDEWDGSNFFMYSNQSALIIIDEKACKVLKKAKLKNIEMKQLQKCWE